MSGLQRRDHRPRRPRQNHLVDKIVHHCNVIDPRKATGDLVLDNNDLERERGITILSKNVAATYKDVKVDLIDTQGTQISVERWSASSKWPTPSSS